MLHAIPQRVCESIDGRQARVGCFGLQSRQCGLTRGHQRRDLGLRPSLLLTLLGKLAQERSPALGALVERAEVRIGRHVLSDHLVEGIWLGMGVGSTHGSR